MLTFTESKIDVDFMVGCDNCNHQMKDDDPIFYVEGHGHETELPDPEEWQYIICGACREEVAKTKKLKQANKDLSRLL